MTPSASLSYVDYEMKTSGVKTITIKCITETHIDDVGFQYEISLNTTHIYVALVMGV
mgnify:FL=1